MPAYLPETEALGTKIVSVFKDNKDKNLPTIQALVLVLDSETGQPKAILDGTYLTALRTGAASGVATDLLARENASAASIIGAGVQGRTQLQAIAAVRRLEKIWIYDRRPSRARNLVEIGETLFPEIIMAQTPSQAVREADIICTATTSDSPVFSDGDLRPGVHINGVGSYTPQMQEIPAETVLRSKIIVDSLSACLEEAGDLIVPLKAGLLTQEHIWGEIGHVASGKITGRSSAEEVTFFKSVGLAVQDAAVAELAYQRARALNLGSDIEL
jgi:ornithine cyclodeaminase/alanine dehydrogenase-like protein (mu-crystallin family)